MKKFSKKGVLLFAGAMAVCAFALPSMASASSWGVVGSHHVLDTSNIGFTSVIGSSMCANASFTARVLSAADLQITAGTFTNCTLVSAQVGTCVATASGTFTTPWTATAVSTSNIQIHNVDIDIPLDNHAGGAGCLAAGQSLRITGTLTGARWHGNTGGRTIELLGSSGLVAHGPGLPTTPVAPTGTITDTQETLTVTG